MVVQGQRSVIEATGPILAFYSYEVWVGDNMEYRFNTKCGASSLNGGVNKPNTIEVECNLPGRYTFIVPIEKFSDIEGT